MRTILFALLLSGSFLLAQNSNANPSQHDSKDSKGQVTVRGCVGRSSGDYILTKQDPGVTYQLQATGKIRFKNYLGQRVEVTGDEGPTLASSSDAMNKVGSASSETITVRSIRTIDKECELR